MYVCIYYIVYVIRFHLIITTNHNLFTFYTCLYFSITELRWDDCNIVVLDNVTIRPPYDTSSISSTNESQLHEHVQKIVSTTKK